LAVWSSCLWPAAVRGEELAVDLTKTPDSTRSNAWPARPRQARTRSIPSLTILRAFRRVPSGVGVRADRIAHCPATHRAAGFLIETDSVSVIGPSSRENLASFSSWGRLTACSMRSAIQDRVIGLDIPRFAPRRPAISLNFTRPAAKKRPSNRPVIRLSIRTYQLAATLSNRSKFPAGFAEIRAFPSRQSHRAQPPNVRIVLRRHSRVI
jgi:hypothetical protein